MKKEECPKENVCNAALCPLAPEDEIKNYTWFPIWDGTMCNNQKVNQLDWVRNQRKYQKIQAKGYFTVEMLKVNCRIQEGHTALDPDLLEKPQLNKWFKDHPPKKELSKEEKAKRGERIRSKVGKK